MKIYKCNTCGRIIEEHVKGKGSIICCEKPMIELKELHLAEGKEKHKPVINKENNEVIVKIGSIEHPMNEEHSIKFIQIINENNECQTKYLKPTDKPEARFKVKENNNITARAYCNLHGLWSNE